MHAFQATLNRPDRLMNMQASIDAEIYHGKHFPEILPRPNADISADREGQMAIKGAILLCMYCTFQSLLGEEVRRESSPSLQRGSFPMLWLCMQVRYTGAEH